MLQFLFHLQQVRGGPVSVHARSNCTSRQKVRVELADVSPIEHGDERRRATKILKLQRRSIILNLHNEKVV